MVSLHEKKPIKTPTIYVIEMTRAEVMEALRQFCNKKLKKKLPQSAYEFESQRDGGCMAGYDEISGRQFRFTMTDYSE